MVIGFAILPRLPLIIVFKSIKRYITCENLRAMSNNPKIKKKILLMRNKCMNTMTATAQFLPCLTPSKHVRRRMGEWM